MGWLSSWLKGSRIFHKAEHTRMGVPAISNLQGIGASVAVKGVRPGDAGSDLYSGYKMMYGDAFANGRPDTWSPVKTGAGYSTTRAVSGIRNTNISYPAQPRSLYTDPEYVGGVVGVARGKLGSDGVSVSNGAVFTASPLPAALAGNTPNDYVSGSGTATQRASLQSGRICTFPNALWSGQGDWIVEGVINVPGTTANGFWPSFWACSHKWPDYGEVDLFEGFKGASTQVAQSNLHVSDVDGGSDVATALSSRSITAGTDTWFLIKKSGTTLSVYDDVATPGTLALRDTYTNSRVGRLRGAWQLLAELAVDTYWDSTAYSASHWPQSWTLRWWRVWGPSAGIDPPPVLYLGETRVAQGGSWAWTAPADSDLFGGLTPDTVEVFGVWDNTQAPGHLLRHPTTQLPGGMTVAGSSPRSLSGTIQHDASAGRVGVAYVGTFTAGGPAVVAIKWFDVAPAPVKMWSYYQVVSSATISQSAPLNIPYEAFHSGNLGPHQINVSISGGSWLTQQSDGKGGVNLFGTAPGGTSTVTLTVSCCNAKGQETTFTSKINVVASTTWPWSAAGAMSSWWPDAMLAWWDFSDDTRNYSTYDPFGSGATNAGVGDYLRAAVDKRCGLVMQQAYDPQRPTVANDATAGQHCAAFSRASSQYLRCMASAIANAVQGYNNGFAVIFTVKRDALGGGSNSETPIGWGNPNLSSPDLQRLYLGSTDRVGLLRQLHGGAANSYPSTNVEISAATWYTLTYVFSGSAITVRKDGSVVTGLNAVAVAADYANYSQMMTLGSIFTGSVWDTLAFGGKIGEVIVLDITDPSDANIGACETYLQAKWHN